MPTCWEFVALPTASAAFALFSIFVFVVCNLEADEKSTRHILTAGSWRITGLVSVFCCVQAQRIAYGANRTCVKEQKQLRFCDAAAGFERNPVVSAALQHVQPDY